MAEKIKKLYRSRKNRILFGVCGGFGEYFETDPTVVRVIAVLLSLVTAIVPVVIAYLIFCLIIPEK